MKNTAQELYDLMRRFSNESDFIEQVPMHLQADMDQLLTEFAVDNDLKLEVE